MIITVELHFRVKFNTYRELMLQSDCVIVLQQVFWIKEIRIFPAILLDYAPFSSET